ncbi:hypothetical protein [Burkholderia vietnamiensis]|uniref:hypothetical protein n=1 Tax=Burkholderia vietnamiensis TaxID=60552 RepID=UPI001CF5D13C|nr:hypothetical protein [Burkholderia vietnamiensis]MCA7985191.1 hypothetical protein [Burkholderia vietnamiensis]
MKDIDQIRRENLKRLEAERGGPAAAAAALGMSHSQFTNLRDGARDSKTGRPRGMRAATARNIEERAGKSLGWLDTDHAAKRGANDAPAGWDQLNVEQRAQVESFIGWLLSQPTAQQNDASSGSKRFGKGG